MDDGVDISLGSEEMDVVVDLWEAQRCLWDPADRDVKNRGARGTAMASIAILDHVVCYSSSSSG